MHRDTLARLNLEADNVLVTACDTVLYLLCGQCERIDHSAAGMRIILEIADLFSFLLQLLRRVEGIVGVTAVQQLLHVDMVYFAPLALPVRTVRTLAVGGFLADALVDAYAEPVQRLNDVLFGPGHEAG